MQRSLQAGSALIACEAVYLCPVSSKRSMDELQRLSVEAFREAPKIPVIVVLDQIRSGLNVGSIFRSADAFCVEEIICCGITPCPPHREVLKTALGATESVKWSAQESTAECLRALRNAGRRTVALEQAHGSTPVTSFHPQVPLAIVLGNEVSGVSDEALAECDEVVEIVQGGTKHSLNVAVSAGIILHHCMVIFRAG